MKQGFGEERTGRTLERGTWRRRGQMALAGLLLVAVHTAAQDRDPRLDYAHKLLEDSSAQRKVEAMAVPDALALHEEARGYYREALESSEAGDQERATERLNLAIRTMFKAIKLSSPESVKRPKQIEDFKRLDASVDALGTALSNISQEKGAEAQIDPILAAVGKLRDEAGGLLEAGKPVKGMEPLSQAYQLLKMNIEGLRGGESLTRSLTFESPEEEYHYEVDRNDTHQMLVKVFAQARIKNETTKKRVDEFVEAATGLRMQAEALAKMEAFEAAIGLLEASTKELIKAIRSAGLYIPS